MKILKAKNQIKIFVPEITTKQHRDFWHTKSGFWSSGNMTDIMTLDNEMNKLKVSYLKAISYGNTKRKIIDIKANAYVSFGLEILIIFLLVF